jgi:fructosamine-3-kinase
VDHDWPPDLPPLASEEPLSGGYICRATRGRLADGRRVVVKRCPYPAEAEADGLTALAAAGAPVPAVLGVAGPVLVLEEVGGPPDWPGLGRAVARLHRTTGDRFGWHRDNFQGITPAQRLVQGLAELLRAAVGTATSHRPQDPPSRCGGGSAGPSPT